MTEKLHTVPELAKDPLFPWKERTIREFIKKKLLQVEWQGNKYFITETEKNRFLSVHKRTK